MTSAAAGSSGVDGDDDELVAIWRCEMHGEGFFSAVLWALGFLETEASSPMLSGFTRAPHRMLVDWTDSRLPYHGGADQRPANAWDAFFEQPPPTDVAEARGQRFARRVDDDVPPTSRQFNDARHGLRRLAPRKFATVASIKRVRLE